MADYIRVLNEEGIRAFAAFLAESRAGGRADIPRYLLQDGRTSDPLALQISVERQDFRTRFAFGEHLVETLSACDPRAISRNHGLWTWLALYHFDYLCPPIDEEGRRNILEDAVYILASQFSFQRYYRHLVRTPWLAVREHGEHAKVLLISSGRGMRSDVAEQLGAYQDVFANRPLIEAAYTMFFDPAAQKLRRGAGGKGSGSPRRLASVVRQLSLTYDLAECSAMQLLSLLPPEFGRWINSRSSVNGG